MQKSLSELTDQDLAQVKNFASLFYTPREIAIILEIDISMFVHGCQEEGSPSFNAFYAGRLLSETELRTSILKLAKAGSSPAQTMALDLYKNSTMKMMDR